MFSAPSSFGHERRHDDAPRLASALRARSLVGGRLADAHVIERLCDFVNVIDVGAESVD